MTPPGRIVTFYSYKGGTGRSMALCNVACLLAQNTTARRGVVAIDWDLEAPGLHRYLGAGPSASGVDGANPVPPTSESKPGLIDLFIDLDQRCRNAAPSSDSRSPAFAKELLMSIRIEDYLIDSEVPNLRFMKAGRFDASYSARTNTFGWEEFYDRAPFVVRAFAEHLVERFDWILVDSRTGTTDISGICTMLLPEVLVLVFTPNRQNLDGVLEIARQAVAFRSQSGDLRPLTVFPLPSRIDNSESVLRDLWRFGGAAKAQHGSQVGYQTLFEKAFSEIYALPECDLRGYFNEVQIPYVPRYAYGEEIATLVERGADALSMSRAFHVIANMLSKATSPWDSNSVENVATGIQELVRAADAVFRALTPAQQELAKYFITRFAKFDDDDAPKVLGSRDAVSVLHEDLELKEVLDRFSSAGIFKIRVGVIDGTDVVTLANPTLVDHWPRVAKWVADDRRLLVLRDRIRARAVLWRMSGMNAGMLLPRGQVEGVALELFDRPLAWSALERSYIEASRRSASRRFGLWTGAMIGAFVIAFGIFVWARRDGKHERPATNENPTTVRTDSVAPPVMEDATRFSSGAEIRPREKVEPSKSIPSSVFVGVLVNASGKAIGAGWRVVFRDLSSKSEGKEIVSEPTGWDGEFVIPIRSGSRIQPLRALGPSGEEVTLTAQKAIALREKGERRMVIQLSTERPHQKPYYQGRGVKE